MRGSILKKSEILDVKEVIINKEMTQEYSDGKAKLQEVCQECDQLIKNAVSFFSQLVCTR